MSAKLQGITLLVDPGRSAFAKPARDLQAVSNLIGAIEIAVAALIALRPFSAKLSFIGSIGAVITFLLTVSFLFSTPGAFHFSRGFPVLGDAGQFLIKDLVLLGASIWTAAEARKEN